MRGDRFSALISWLSITWVLSFGDHMPSLVSNCNLRIIATLFSCFWSAFFTTSLSQRQMNGVNTNKRWKYQGNEVIEPLSNVAARYTAMRTKESSMLPTHKWFLFHGGSLNSGSVRNTNEADTTHVHIASDANVIAPADTLAGPE